MHGRALMLVAAAAGLLTACEDDSTSPTTTTYSASLTGGNEVPAVQTSGSGTWTATLDANNVLSYTLVVTSMSSNVTMAHIHGPGATGVIASVIVDFAAGGRTLLTGVTSGTSTGTIDLKIAQTATISGDSLRTLLNNGNAYVNVHTVTNGGGEIRGQIVRQ